LIRPPLRLAKYHDGNVCLSYYPFTKTVVLVLGDKFRKLKKVVSRIRRGWTRRKRPFTSNDLMIGFSINRRSSSSSQLIMTVGLINTSASTNEVVEKKGELIVLKKLTTCSCVEHQKM
jgi:hypothetical protein